ncbi:tryptophan-rich sensory protein [Nocardioides flavus (ex Wang et al. 2016)]|uniref:Tryptophan-rich sensory protein n=1 Tax=Nocardioides flavus (ex Wang et al. 2016) TaxID=2058780 RepID=A0ABQ3HNH6_9ACTN|nr:TspO/MBR family protein [Nocardioides flavus (ex Wang et al. 2016)]GHE18217.1 tryptophan-rich sensory protein [Nocardioides flavus (ex Wang et al. 2016)]
MTAWAPVLTWCVLVVAFAALSNVWNGHDPGWYASLARPSFQPPDVVFAVMWPLNFALLLVVGLGVVRTASAGPAWVATGVLAASVALALGWAWLFYVPHALAPAAASLTGAAVLTWALVVVVGRVEAWGGLLLTPYALWLSVATALSVAYARLG